MMRELQPPTPPAHDSPADTAHDSPAKHDSSHAERTNHLMVEPRVMIETTARLWPRRSQAAHFDAAHTPEPTQDAGQAAAQAPAPPPDAAPAPTALQDVDAAPTPDAAAHADADAALTPDAAARAVPIARPLAKAPPPQVLPDTILRLPADPTWQGRGRGRQRAALLAHLDGVGAARQPQSRR